MAITSSGLGHQGGWQASMPDISQPQETGACGSDLAANPTLLPQQIGVGRHKDGGKAGRRVTLPRRYLNRRHQSEEAAGLFGHENAFLQSLSSGLLSKSE